MSLDRRQKETLHIEYATFCIISQPVTKYNLRAFRVDESFWTQKQSCITQKVGLEKWCLFFDFVRFSGRHFKKSGFSQQKFGIFLFQFSFSYRIFAIISHI